MTVDWLKKLLLKGVKDQAVKAMRDFKWSDRERAELRAAGYSDTEIIVSESMNRTAGASWVDRQVKL